MKLRSALLVATMLAVPLAAKAEAISGIYIGAGAGANFLQDESLRSVTIGNTLVNNGKTRFSFDTGFRLLASVGYGLGNGLRFEIEGDYIHNQFDKIGRVNQGGLFGSSFVRTPGVRVNGDEEKYGGFFNVLYDFDPNVLGLGSFPAPITPYLGVGAGYLQVQNANVRVQADNRSFLLRSTGTDGNFAYQGIVGAAFPIAPVPGLAITAEYRFTGIVDNRNFKGQFFAPGVSSRAVLHEQQDYNHSVLLGVRYAFNAAPPPVEAPPPVAPPRAETARTYLVFFDWDRADLTNRARQIVAEAAQATTRIAVTRIEVAGHTDTSGTVKYNQALSVRRANNVAAELVRLGVPRQEISVVGYGESRPLVPTGAGVREPQNRRVEIVLR